MMNGAQNVSCLEDEVEDLGRNRGSFCRLHSFVVSRRLMA